MKNQIKQYMPAFFRDIVYMQKLSFRLSKTCKKKLQMMNSFRKAYDKESQKIKFSILLSNGE